MRLTAESAGCVVRDRIWKSSWAPITALMVASFGSSLAVSASEFSLATFSADVTIPLGHRCMGVLPTKSKKIVDPLYAHGFVLLGDVEPIVLVAVDWCEIRNGAYDQWRSEIARAVKTSRERVLVCSLHQHDAPVTDNDAARLLRGVGLSGELHDEAFHDQTVRRVARAAEQSIPHAVPISHFGIGRAKVDQVASNRRVVHPDGRVTFGRGSRSGADPFHRDAPIGLIDPYLKTFSFWNGRKAVLAVHAYATHPMSYYGRGEVTSDFVGLARERRQRDDRSVKQIYVSGCSGDVTAGKHNDGSPEARGLLADRIYAAMVAAWETTRRVPMRSIAFRNTSLTLEYSRDANLVEDALVAALKDNKRTIEKRIFAAMSLASRRRVAREQSIDMPCIDFGEAQIVLFPGEAFVGYQLMAQRLRSDSFVLSIGYGECWPGYIPTASAFNDGFQDNWLWVAPGSETRMRSALERVLLAPIQEVR